MLIRTRFYYLSVYDPPEKYQEVMCCCAIIEFYKISCFWLIILELNCHVSNSFAFGYFADINPLQLRHCFLDMT